jgi:hypothetical protein
MIIRWIETENRDRVAHGRPPYHVANAAEFIEGARERLPLIAAAREEEARQARLHPHRTVATDDASAPSTQSTDASAVPTAAQPTSENESRGNAAMGAGPDASAHEFGDAHHP